MQWSGDYFKKKGLWLSLAGMLLIAVILKNNWELIGSGSNHAPEKNSRKAEVDSTFSLKAPSNKPLRPDTISPEPPSIAQNKAMEPPEASAPPSTRKEKTAIQTKSLPQVQEKVPLYVYRTGTIITPLAGEPMLEILLQVELRYKEPALKDELNFKSNGLEALIRNRISKKKKGELSADLLRKDLKSSINGYLKAGAVQDIIFTDFKIEIRKQ